jgi:predicted nuclease with TOPRIM domain
MIILDCIIAIMLMISIVYSWQLNKRFATFRDNKKDFSELTRALDESIIRAENGIVELKNLNNKVNSDLREKISTGTTLYQDLAYIVDRAHVSIDKLDQAISEVRQLEKMEFSQLYKEQFEKYKKSLQPASLETQNHTQTSAAKPIQKVAIESLLQRISAVNNAKKDKVF